MINQPQRQARLTIKDDLAFLPTVQTFVEKTALAFGLGQTEALALTLAGEEIFNYLCTQVKPEAEIEISCYNGGYYAALEFILPIRNLAMRTFNLTATINIDDENSLDEMGLLLASRMVDHLQIGQNDNGRLQLLLRKEKSYPKTTATNRAPSKPATKNFSIITPEAEELKFFISESHHYTSPELLPQEFSYPGKIVDMVKAGDYQAAIVRDSTGRIGGGIIWYWSSTKMVECYGPFILADDTTPSISPELRQTMAEALLEYCLNAIARSPAVGLLNRSPSPDLPQHHFETLGTVLEYHNTSLPTERPSLFRQMQEDPGAVTWTDPNFEPFLRSEYQRLTLPREIRLTSDSGENRADFSVLASEFDRARHKVTLRPLWAGNDMEKNIADHLTLFTREGLDNIFFIIDLGQSWQAAFGPALRENSFTPRLLLPHGGKGDLLILQKTEPKKTESVS
ncbi:MAG: hypothetical protein J7L25_12275 [Deltaproteobacteria bacterium]|nr:hypothetical protein [Candidatus Tharpella aukensis]